MKEIDFSTAFQPIIDVSQKRVISYEALLRGPNNEPPAFVFSQVPTSEIMEFDQLIRNYALNLAKRLGVKCSINLNFVPESIFCGESKYVIQTLNQTKSIGFSSKQLVVEISENELIKGSEELTSKLNEIRKNGVILSIDDFGAGYAGLNMLVDILPDTIKLDRHLISDIHKLGSKQSVVRAIANVCFELGIDLLAEGVEKKEEFRVLNDLGIRLFQGYLFARPGFECLPEVDYVV